MSEKARDYLCGAIIYFYKKGMDFPETMISIAAQTPRSLVSEIIEHMTVMLLGIYLNLIQ